MTIERGSIQQSRVQSRIGKGQFLGPEPDCSLPEQYQSIFNSLKFGFWDSRYSKTRNDNTAGIDYIRKQSGLLYQNSLSQDDPSIRDWQRIWENYVLLPTKLVEVLCLLHYY